MIGDTVSRNDGRQAAHELRQMIPIVLAGKHLHRIAYFRHEDNVQMTISSGTRHGNPVAATQQRLESPQVQDQKRHERSMIDRPEARNGS